jgi:hypothetical protein
MNIKYASHAERGSNHKVTNTKVNRSNNNDICADIKQQYHESFDNMLSC